MKQIVFAALVVAAWAADAPAAGIGVNLDENSIWGTARTWVNVKNLFSRWGMPGNPWADNPDLMLTADGYPLSDASAFSPLNSYPDGIYQLSYEGTGTVTFAGGAQLAGPLTTNGNVTTADVMVNHPDGDISMTIWSIDPQDPVRNLRLIAPGYAADTAQTFTDEFLDRVRPFSTLRFMDWMETNSSPVGNWADRTTPTSFLRTGPKGVAWEDVIALANESGTDIWINIPDQATDDYVHQLARLLVSQLNADSLVYLEYSNECWNPIFPQYQRIVDDSRANPLLTHDDEWGRNAEQSAYKLKVFSHIFRREFGAQAARVKPVFCGIMVAPYWQQSGLEFISNTYGPPRNYFAALGVNSYIYLNDDRDGLTMDDLFASMNQYLNFDNTDQIRQNKALAAQYNLRLYAFEGGQSLSGDQNESLKRAAQYDPQMGTLYRDMIGNWQREGGGLFMHYAHISPYGQWGYWGLMESNIPGQTSVKWDTIMQLLLPGERSIPRGRSGKPGRFAKAPRVGPGGDQLIPSTLRSVRRRPTRMRRPVGTP